MPLVGPAWRQVFTGASTYIGLLGLSPLTARGGKQVSGSLYNPDARGCCRRLLDLLVAAGIPDFRQGDMPCSGVAVVKVYPGTPLIPFCVAAEAAVALGLPEPGVAAEHMRSRFLWEPMEPTPPRG